MCLRVKLLGPPRVQFGDKIIRFPFRKAEALFYYLIVEGAVSRDKLAGMLWGEYDQFYALKNLRNALYVLHKSLPTDFIIQDAQWIRIKDSAPIYVDIKMLNDLDKLPIYSLKDLVGEFLDGFSAPTCPEYEEWIVSKRMHFRNTCIDLLKSRMMSCCESKSYDTALEVAKLAIKLDEFDEDTIRSIMHIYVSLGQIVKALQTYKTFKSRVRDILKANPDTLTESLYNDVLSLHQSNIASRLNNKLMVASSDLIFGREDELAMLHAFCTSPNLTQRPKCVLVTGVPGVGKSFLIRHFIETNLGLSDMLLSCKATGKSSSNYPLGPWHELLAELTDSNPMPIGLHTPASLSGILSKNLEHKIKSSEKIILYIENLYDFDQASIELFRYFLSHLPTGLIIIIETRSDDAYNIDALLKNLHRSDSLSYMHIKIHPFTKEDTWSFCNFLLPSHRISPEEFEKIYHYTEGLPLFLKEILGLIAEGKNLDLFPGKLKDVVREHLALLSEFERKLLQTISIFNSDASRSLLKSIFNTDESIFSDAINALTGKGFIVEKVDDKGQLCYSFSHLEIKEIIYDLIDREKRRSLHEQLASLIEKEGNDWSNIGWREGMNLAHHLHQAGLLMEELEVRLQLLKLHLSLNHELFPMLSDETLKSTRVPFSEMESTTIYSKNIRELLCEIHKSTAANSKHEVLENTYLWLNGSYLIWYGRYHEGLQKIYDSLRWAKHKGESKLELDCLAGLCYFGIQTENGPMLKKYALEMLKTAQSNFLDHYIGTSLRFLGLGYMLTGDLKRAEASLKASIRAIERFNSTRPRHSIGIIAALNYLGDIKHWEGKFKESLILYESCISLCNKRGLYHGLSLFHANAGHVAYDLNDKSLMLYHLNKSLQLHQYYHGGRGAALSHTLLALYWTLKRNPREAIAHLREADKICETLKKKYWIGLLLYVKALMRTAMDHNDEFQGLWSDDLHQGAAEYAGKAVSIFEDLHIEHERQKACDLLACLLSDKDISPYLTV